MRLSLVALAVATAAGPALVSCGAKEKPLAPRTQTWAELRTVRRSVAVKPPNESERAPYPRERLVDGEEVTVGPEGLAWLRRDGGATLLVHGPARLQLRAGSIRVDEGRVFVDTPSGATTEVVTPSGPLFLAHVRASIDVSKQGATEAYVLAGEVRAERAAKCDKPPCPTTIVRAGAGERLTMSGKAGAAEIATKPALTWEDWTGGLATTDRSPEPAPYGVGTVGARPPGDQGSPRFPLAIQRLDVRVTIDDDLAITEVDEVFFNPSSERVEGIYRFRTPDGASLHRFGVDRDGAIVWGRVKEKAAAAAQYQANVFQGSEEDPALLEWDAPGVYRARLYPIGPGETRRVVVRYAEWLSRSGQRGERRHYVYPMAAEGAESSVPHIEELTATIDLARSGAKEIRSGMAGVREGGFVTVRAQDHVPRADLSVELFDDGAQGAAGYRAVHVPDLEAMPPAQREQATKDAKKEADYLLVPVRAADMPLTAGGLDLAIVVDSSAANDAASMAIARAATTALLAHLGPEDRAAVWAGDDSLRPVVAGRDALARVDDAARRELAEGLASLERGGATDLGAMLAAAAGRLDATRRGAVVYVGDGAPTVGELSLADLRERLSKLPRPVRVFGLGVGDQADMGILKGLARGAFAERIGDASGAARAALRLLEQAERPVWLGASIDLGTNVERVFPRDTGALVADETLLVVGRMVGAQTPMTATVKGPEGSKALPVRMKILDDHGDLRRRWAEARLVQMIDDGTGRAAMVDLGTRHQIITPVTSLYVPTRKEMTPEELQELARNRDRDRGGKNRGPGSGGWARLESKDKSEDVDELEERAQNNADNKEGGTGTRAKGEEGSMGNPSSKTSGHRYGVAGPADSPAPSSPPAATAVAAPELPAARPAEGKSDGSDRRELAKSPAQDAAPKGGANADPHIARQKSLSEAQEFGMIGLLNAGAGGDPNAPTAPWGRDDSLGSDPMSARGNMWGDQAGEAVGVGGLGLTGVGEGGGGRGEGQGLGLGSIGTIGHGAGTGTGQGFGSGHGRLGGAHKSKPPSVRMGATTVTGRLPPEVIQRIVRQNFGRFRLCYEKGLTSNPNLQGRVSVRFVIGRDGAVSNVGNAGSDMPDGGVVGCVVKSFSGLTFPMPEGGIVNVTYPIMFSPGDGDVAAGGADAKAKSSAPVSKESVVLRTGDVPRVAVKCGGGAIIPLDERIQLWRERLGKVAGNAQAVAGVYRRALMSCEAPTWRERSRLLSMLLDAMPSVNGRVQLWRTMFQDLGAADALYRGMLARVKTAVDMRELHSALGLKHVDPTLLAKALKDLKTPAERVKKLRALAFEWPDDFTLALKLLDTLEDAGDASAARELGRKLRARPDADARVRTAVGELYLRLAAKSEDKGVRSAHEAEARRAFGEIVEFAPDDPVARRRLGDLLRAHGWFPEAARQYETLMRLAPDDPAVALLLAAAAEGRGLLEEAVKWTEKGGAAGAPDVDQGPATTARALAATYLAWGRIAAKEAGKKDEVAALSARAARVLSGARSGPSKDRRGPRVTLTWTHPEFHPTLWSTALGAPMPAPEGDTTLGVAQVVLPERDGVALEVRLEPDELEHAARLGATAVITVIWDESEEGETIVKLPVKFEAGDKPTLRFTVKKGEVRRD